MWGFNSPCCYQGNNGYDSWIWIVLIIFIVYFIFCNNGSRGNNFC